MSECIIFQSVRQDGRPFQQLSNMSLSGLSTQTDTANTDKGRLYGTFTFDSGTYSLFLYKDSTKTDMVASATATGTGVASILSENDSGISGAVNICQFAADDSAIQVLCFLSRDADLPMNNLEGLSDYDNDLGFAEFHIEAFEKIKEVVASRYSSLLWNADQIDTAQINGGRGGTDLSRILNWQALKEASAHYAMYRLCERQDVESGTWSRRAEQSRNIYKAHMTATEMQIDLDNNRVTDKARSMFTWKIGRA